MAYTDFNMDNHWLPFTPNRSFMKNPRATECPCTPVPFSVQPTGERSGFFH